jgi:hypothetical protein
MVLFGYSENGGYFMLPETRYHADIDAILAKRFDLGGDFWTTPDRRLMKGGALSALECAHLLLELGVPPEDPVLQGVAGLVMNAWRADGRFKLSPDGSVLPCQTISGAYLLSRMGYAGDERLQKTFQHLLETQHADGGWRCKKFFFGKGPETEFSNPGPTLTALNAFRFTDYLNNEPALDRTVEFLLDHWTTRKPLGPCHYGIGTLFMQAEYPFGNYNLFVYVYVLSFYDRAKQDPRFLEALSALQSKLRDGWIVVERVNRSLSGLEFCRKGQPSELGTLRYREILGNLG